jgi:hypothetical protein
MSSPSRNGGVPDAVDMPSPHRGRLVPYHPSNITQPDIEMTSARRDVPASIDMTSLPAITHVAPQDVAWNPARRALNFQTGSHLPLTYLPPAAPAANAIPLTYTPPTAPPATNARGAVAPAANAIPLPYTPTAVVPATNVHGANLPPVLIGEPDGEVPGPSGFKSAKQIRREAMEAKMALANAESKKRQRDIDEPRTHSKGRMAKNSKGKMSNAGKGKATPARVVTTAFNKAAQEVRKRRRSMKKRVNWIALRSNPTPLPTHRKRVHEKDELVMKGKLKPTTRKVLRLQKREKYNWPVAGDAEAFALTYREEKDKRNNKKKKD